MSEPEDSQESPFFPLLFPFQILISSLQIFSRNKQIFLSIFLFIALPLSLLQFSLSLSSHPLKSHILHLESVLRRSPTRFEFRHVFAESRSDAFSLLRLRAAFFLPIYALSLLAAVAAVSSALLAAASKRPSLRSAASALRLSWPRLLATSLCAYAALLASSLLLKTLPSLAAGSPPLRLLLLLLGAALELYLLAVLGLALVVSIAEDRFGWDAIRAAAGLMAGRRLSGAILTAAFLLASSAIAAEMDGLMDGVDHWAGTAAAVTSHLAVSVGDKFGLISLYGVVIIAGYVVNTVFYCECRKRDFVRLEEGEERDHVVTV